MKRVFSIVGLLFLVLAFVACSGGGSGSGDPDPQVSQVEDAELTAGAGTSDLGATEPVSYSIDATEALEDLGMMLAAVMNDGSDAVMTMAMDEDQTAFDNWMLSFSATTIPSDFTALTSMPEYISILGSVVSTAAFGNSSILTGAEANMTLEIDLDGNENPTHVKLTMELENFCINVDTPLSGDVDFTTVSVEDGKMAVSANLNLDLYITWSYDADWDEYYPTAFTGAYSTSMLAEAALSGAQGTPTRGGNIVASFTMKDSAKLSLDETMMSDEAAMEEYLETTVQPDTFALTITNYDKDGTAVFPTETLTIDDLIAMVP